MRQIVENILGGLARQIVAKYKPVIVGITGSTGKTSTRRAVVAALSKRYRVSTPPRNLNDKLGLPLGIIGLDTPGRSATGWFVVIVKAMSKILNNVRYPEVLVLEYGIDRVGEMDELLSIAKPNIGVLTGIGLSHYEFFQDEETIAQEKGKLVLAVPKNGTVVVNATNAKSLEVTKSVEAKVIAYGTQGAGVSVLSVSEDLEKGVSSLQLKGQKDTYSFEVKAVGRPHVLAACAAVAVAESMDVEKKDLEEGLAGYVPMPGRLNLIQGLKKSWVIDDTYNSAPDSVVEALEVFARMQSPHKIAVLGDMLELGSLSQEEHQKVGRMVAEISPQHLVTVGEMGKVIADSAKAAGLPEERIVAMDKSSEAAPVVHDLVEEGSLVLCKGSQGVRLEKVVKEIMAEPMRAKDLLARQDTKWLNS